MSDIVCPLTLNHLSFDFLNNPCIPSSQWQILENIRTQYEKKMEKALEENENYRKDIKKLENEKNRLEADKEELVNDVQDLRALLRRVHEEGEIQIKKLIKKNKQLKKETESFRSSIECLHTHGKHFDNIGSYWQEFLSI